MIFKDFSIIGFGDFFLEEEKRNKIKEEKFLVKISILQKIGIKILKAGLFGVYAGIATIVFSFFAKISFYIFLWL